MIGSAIGGKSARGRGALTGRLGKFSLVGRESFPTDAETACARADWRDVGAGMVPAFGSGMLSVNRIPGVLAAGLLLAGGGCMAMKSPARNAGPALSDKGIQIAVVGQSCSQTQ